MTHRVARVGLRRAGIREVDVVGAENRVGGFLNGLRAHRVVARRSVAGARYPHAIARAKSLEFDDRHGDVVNEEFGVEKRRRVGEYRVVFARRASNEHDAEYRPIGDEHEKGEEERERAHAIDARTARARGAQKERDERNGE